MNEITIQNDFAKQLGELEKIQDICKKLMQTKHYANLGEAGIHAIISRAKALGIHPFEALNGGFYCIGGKIGMSSEMMAALARQRGHSITKDPKSNNEICILHGKRADNGDVWTCIFSKDDAVVAGLWNGAVWKKYPGVMLYNRCMSMLFRQLFPDLSLGAGYSEDELKEIAKVEDYAVTKNTTNLENLPIADVEEVNNKPLVSIDQVLILEEMIGNDKNYKDQVMKRVVANGFKSFSDMTITFYEQILTYTRKRIEEKLQKQAEAILEGPVKDA